MKPITMTSEERRVKKLECGRKYYIENRKQEIRRVQKYHVAHREEMIETARKYRTAHPEKARECSRKYRTTHPEKVQETARKYSIAHPERHKEYLASMKSNVYDHYGHACVGCGETEPAVLSIDHINGGGNRHRKEIGSGSHMYLWLIKNGFPEGFRVLCMNCQFRAKYGKPFPNDFKDKLCAS